MDAQGIAYSRGVMRLRRRAGIWFERSETLLARARLARLRGGNDTVWRSTDVPEPLVTVRVATTGTRPELLSRCLPSITTQSYKRLEILVVGDGATGPILDSVRSLGDSRIRVHNLSRPGRYPRDPHYRWMVAGCAPMNWGLRHSSGQWIAPCDDDDEFTVDHIETLLHRARADAAELVHSKTLIRYADGSSEILGNGEFRSGQVSHGSVFYAAQLKFIRHNVRSWWLNQPADANMWRRMARFGVRVTFEPSITYVYHHRGSPKSRS